MWCLFSVLYISVHRGDIFPVGDLGSFDNVGVGKGAGFNVNIPWAKVSVHLFHLTARVIVSHFYLHDLNCDVVGVCVFISVHIPLRTDFTDTRTALRLFSLFQFFLVFSYRFSFRFSFCVVGLVSLP